MGTRPHIAVGKAGEARGPDVSELVAVEFYRGELNGDPFARGRLAVTRASAGRAGGAARDERIRRAKEPEFYECEICDGEYRIAEFYSGEIYVDPLYVEEFYVGHCYVKPACLDELYFNELYLDGLYVYEFYVEEFYASRLYV